MELPQKYMPGEYEVLAVMFSHNRESFCVGHIQIATKCVQRKCDA